ncbi:2Fe-2S iron-sulfur cluster-binding protein [Acidimicrobiaceae bacterium]|nr:2Fe-2S iron-sulfur cluster-binding protein [Acidimicrobiaceae bacterium]
MDINLKILRYDPESDRKGHWENYIVDAEPEERILDLLHKIKWFEDGSLSFRRSCAHGVCGSDAMVINGENMLACQVLVKEVVAMDFGEKLFQGLPEDAAKDQKVIDAYLGVSG